MTYPNISIIIPAYNESKYIEQCLRSVVELDYPSNRLEIIVIDNGSTDATPEIVSKVLYKVQNAQVLSKVGGTIASVRNFGVMHARGDFIAFLDGDCVVPNDWLSKGISLFNQDQCVSCVGFAVSPPCETDSWVERTWYPLSSAGKIVGTKEVGWLSTFNMIIEKSYFDSIGGFDESLVTCEDVDFGNRISGRSKIIFSDACSVRHLGTVKTVPEFFRKERWRGKSTFSSLFKQDFTTLNYLKSLIPFIYLVLIIFGLLTGLISLFFSSVLDYFLFFLFLIVLFPLLLSLRSSRNTDKKLFSKVLLSAIYLIARGTSIVK